MNHPNISDLRVDSFPRLNNAPAPLIYGHRGASGERPEHTVESYTRAVEQGADYFEPDLVCTKDHVLVARHENEIGGTTDVAEKFPKRKTTKTIDGIQYTGWFIEDFTWAEVKTLRARERLASRSQEFNGRYGILSFKEILDLRERLSKQTGRVIGVIPEIKHATYHASIKCPITELTMKELHARHLDNAEAPVIIQSFETENLRQIRAQSSVRTVQLIDEATAAPADWVAAGRKGTYADLLTEDGLKELKKTVTGIAPWKNHIVPVKDDGSFGPPTDLIQRAHALGLSVTAWTFRSDKEFLPAGYGGVPAREYEVFSRLGLDAFFTDFPAHAIQALHPEIDTE